MKNPLRSYFTLAAVVAGVIALVQIGLWLVNIRNDLTVMAGAASLIAAGGVVFYFIIKLIGGGNGPDLGSYDQGDNE